jgi:formate hydrogenlyase subunit 4
MKFLVLILIFLNVLVTPWGLAQGMGPGEVLLAIPLVLLKVLGFIVVLVYIESSLAKLRLFRITEFLGAAFVICVVAMLTRLSAI